MKKYTALAADATDVESALPDTQANVSFQATDGEKSESNIVQFTSAIYIVHESEGSITCDIMRIGDLKGYLSFSYSTQEKSARPGRQFVPCSGRIEMSPGQDSTSIELQILSDRRWNPTTEFCVCLSDAKDCNLGLYLKTARVKVMDAAAFPTSKFKKELREGDEAIESINKFQLFVEFIKLMWTFDGIWWRTILTLLLDQLKNVYVYVRLIVSIYMVDTVFNMASHEGLLIADDRLKTSYCIAAIILGPMIILFFVDGAKTNMDIKGRLQRDLSQCLFRKFMNYNQEAQDDVPLPDMMTALETGAGEVTKGYIFVLESVRLGGQVAISISFVLQQNPDAWWAVVLVPSLIALWCCIRTRKFITASKCSGDCESAVVTFVNEVLSKLALVAEYAQRPQINDSFAEKVEKLRQVNIPLTHVSINNMYFPRFLGPALVALYTAIGAQLVLENKLKLGVFLATVSVFGDICGTFSDFFGLVMDIIGTFEPLVGITCMLNKPIDVPSWKDVNRKRRAETKQLRAQVLRELSNSAESDGKPFVPASDQMPISMDKMTFAYPGSEPLFKDLCMSCKQGCIHGVVGPPGRGRKTFMHVIAHKVFPTGGMVFVPSHLRILYVSTEPVLLNLSVWQNLTFGNRTGNNPFRVESILKKLGMIHVLELCERELAARKEEFTAAETGEQPGHSGRGDKEPEQETEKPVIKHNFLDKLRVTQKSDIHLARAFIMNPEVLVLHRPFLAYQGLPNYRHIMEAIVSHRENRGFKMSPKTIGSRRPRTIFFCPDNEGEEMMADSIWMLQGHMVVERKPSSNADRKAPGQRNPYSQLFTL